MGAAERLSDFFVDQPMLVPAWRVTAIRADRDCTNLRFTSNQNIRVDIKLRKDGLYDVQAVRGIYKVKNKIDAKKVSPNNLKNVLDEIILEFFELNKLEASEASRKKYNSKKFD